MEIDRKNGLDHFIAVLRRFEICIISTKNLLFQTIFPKSKSLKCISPSRAILAILAKNEKMRNLFEQKIQKYLKALEKYQ